MMHLDQRVKLIKVEYPVAREEHMCEDCRYPISPGEKYQKEIFEFIDDGTIVSGKVHIECPNTTT